MGERIIMGIFISLNISKSVTKDEWKKVYEETLDLIKYLPFGESRIKEIHGIKTLCFVPTEERTENGKWITRTGWCTEGDYQQLTTAESFYLNRDLIDENVLPDAGDAMMETISNCLNLRYADDCSRKNYRLWGSKTQGESYHKYLLAVGCLIESRLGLKAYVCGDITRGQCKHAVEIANEFLKTSIEMPDRCYPDRLMKRISALPLTDIEKLEAFEYSYLGTKDASFGKIIREYFPEDVIESYWKKRLTAFHIRQIGYYDCIKEYLTMGFDLGKLCRNVNLTDLEGADQHERFIECIMDCKMHWREKDCTDPLKINQENQGQYTIWTHMAQFFFAGLSNKKVDRYIPIEELRQSLVVGLREYDDVDKVIDEYLKAEENVLDEAKAAETAVSVENENNFHKHASELFLQTVEKKKNELMEIRSTYDISDRRLLKYYAPGDTMPDELIAVIKNLRQLLDSLHKEETFISYNQKSAKEKCLWLVQQRSNLLLRDIDWEKIYTEIENTEDAFARYYPFFRLELRTMDKIQMCTALIINDNLYDYSGRLV